MDGESLVRMEGVLLATWPALETAERDGWVAGANGGFTGRANSVTVLRHTPGDAVASLAGWAEAWYRERDAPPAFRLTPLSAQLEPVLTERGYRRWRNGASVMVGDLGPLRDLGVPRGHAVDAAPTADEAWYRLAGHGPTAQATLNQMFDGVAPPSIHIGIHRGHEIAAIGRGVLHDGHLAIFGMETAAAHRRRGLARAVIGALARWGVDGGAERATLQVEIGNDAAHALYERLGFTAAYGYTYLALEM